MAPPESSPAPTVPAVELVGPNGRRVLVAPHSVDDVIGDLADALADVPPAAGDADRAGRRADGETPQLTVDGRTVGRDETLAQAGIVRGSWIAWQRGQSRPMSDALPAATVACVAGPATGAAVAVRAGRHVVGRGPHVSIRVDDTSIEPHHAVLDVHVDGTMSITQVAGRTPCRMSGVALAGATPVAPGTTLQLGASRLQVIAGAAAANEAHGDAAATLASTPGDPWRRSLQRTPRPLPSWVPTPIPIPSIPPPRARAGGIGLASAVVGVLGAGAVALLARQPMFLLFGLLGLFIAGGTWMAGRVGVARDGRRSGVHRQREWDAFGVALDAQATDRLRHHVQTTPTVSDAVTAAVTLRSDLWARRGDHPDAFAVTLGWGEGRWSAAIADGDLPPELGALVAAAESFTDVPVATTLGRAAALAVVGAGADAVVRSLVVQLATWTGPADWRLVVITEAPARWDWCRWLPHAAVGDAMTVVDAELPDAVASMVARLDDGDDRHVVVVTDRPDVLSARTGVVRRFLAAAPSTAVVVQVPSTERVPALCCSMLEVGSLGAGRWIADATTASAPEHVHIAGISPATASAVARRLSGLHDPEDGRAGASGLAASISLDTLLARHGVGPVDDAIAVAAAWRSDDDPPPAAVVGIAGDGVVEVDLVRDGPHALIAGTTGSGKSELLRTLVVSLAARSSPEHLTFVLIDYKGGSTFDACAELPHTVGLVTDLDERLAERALVSLRAELHRRERLLRSAGAADLAEYRAAADRPALPRLVVVVDEFAALATELPTFLSSLVGIAQRGRSLGVHLVLATQRPAGVVSDEIRANTNLRIALRLHDPAESRDIVGDGAPASFARGMPGRAMMRLGPGEMVTFQAARTSGPLALRRDEHLRVVTGDDVTTSRDVTELTVLVRSIRHAAALCDIAAPHRPWLPPLPAVLDGELLEAGAVGIVDEPTAQRQRPLRWQPGDGSLALIGARGTGTTTALLSIVGATCAARASDEVHVYVIDAGGDARLDAIGQLPHCGGVVRLHESERRSRLLRCLATELDRRRASVSTVGRFGAAVVLAIDGLPAVRAALDSPAAATDLDALLRLVAEGPGLGVTCVVTAERPGAVAPSVLAACTDRWVFHLDDRAEAPAAGVPSSLVPPNVAGRVVVASSGLEAQVAPLASPGPRRAGGTASGPPPIGILPADVAAGDLAPGRVGANGELRLTLGVDFHSLETATLTVPDGEHVLVAGPARSGRTTALVRLVASWREAHPDGDVHFLRSASTRPIDGLDPSTADAATLEVATKGPCLVVIDDAERVDDHTDRLGALVSSRRPGLLVVAAGRPEALRPLYGHWTSLVRRSRLGLLMSACADHDGDVLGEMLPRHPPLRPRPGLAWVIGPGDRRLVQIAR